MWAINFTAAVMQYVYEGAGIFLGALSCQNYWSPYNKGKNPAINAVVSHNFHFKSLLSPSTGRRTYAIYTSISITAIKRILYSHIKLPDLYIPS